MTKPTESLKAYWRSLADHDGSLQPQVDEFPGLAQTQADQSEFVPATSLARRKFMGLLGAQAALAGLTTGCLRKPVEHIVPLSKRPEDMIPGASVYYASAFQSGSTVMGLLVESIDGRPIKVEGNPRHSGSLGSTDIPAQGSVLDLYDPNRSRHPLKKGEATDWDTVATELGATIKELRGKQGQGLALVVPTILSPSLRDALKTFTTNFPKARLFDGDVAGPANQVAGAELLAGPGARFTYHLQGARVIFSADSDFIGTEQDHVRLAREFADSREALTPADAAGMSRLYAVEPHFTITGAQADHRLRMRASQVGAILVALAKELRAGSKAAGLEAALDALPQVTLTDAETNFVRVLAKDLLAAKEARDAHSAVLVGERQPAWVHGLGLVINLMLGNIGSSVRLRHDDTAPKTEPIAKLGEALGAGVDTVICLETNPAFDAPGDLDLANKLKAATVVHLGAYVDETGKLAAWHLPASHYLEAWGDLEAVDATISIVQPLIAPLHDTRSALEVLSWIASDAQVDGYSLVRGFWTRTLGAMWSDKVWRRWLHDGVVNGVPRSGQNPQPREFAALAGAMKGADFAADKLEVNFHIDPRIVDGRHANNGWLQECPHPMTKLAWDNAAYVSITTARKLGVQNCDLVTVQVGGRSVQLPVWIAPGQADDTVSVAVGYGRKDLGMVANGAGVDVYPLQAAANRWFAAGEVVKFGGQRKVYSTQDWGSLSPAIDTASTVDDMDPKHANPGRGYPDRPIVRETTLDQYKADPKKFVAEGDLMKPEQLVSLWDHNTHPDFGAPALLGKQQWGMVIDLNRCTGCSACTVACQAENNIPVVGRSQVANGREMHWIRLDRYYSGAKEDPAAVVQPMLCQHCETAPCENVCPVAATAHSPEGLNDMAYNRCIGTRYCSNNCPYKVRRFNFFNFNRDPINAEDPEKLRWMQKNPNVTVRFRGVIEKCSYCVQRIQEAKIQAHTAGEDTVKDGVIVTACQQVCPSAAITFGDVADPTTRVAKLRASARNYGVLTDLNTRPRTTYLGRVRNPNPELAPPAPVAKAEEHKPTGAGGH